jgi:hypothetical protein
MNTRQGPERGTSSARSGYDEEGRISNIRTLLSNRVCCGPGTSRAPLNSGVH